MPQPRTTVLAFMASLSLAAGFSPRCYVDELLATLAICGAQEKA